MNVPGDVDIVACHFSCRLHSSEVYGRSTPSVPVTSQPVPTLFCARTSAHVVTCPRTELGTTTRAAVADASRKFCASHRHTARRNVFTEMARSARQIRPQPVSVILGSGHLGA